MTYENNLKTFLPTSDPTERQKEVSKLLVNLTKKYRKSPEIERTGAIPRSRISDKIITAEDLINAGFKESLVAVPETGQDELTTYRHPRSGLHFHKHEDSWLYHEDKHPSLSMVMERFTQDNPNASLLDKLKFMNTKAISDSYQHIVHEGLPGWVRWIAGSLKGSRGFNSENEAPDYLKGATNSLIGLGSLTLLDYLTSKGASGLSTVPENASALVGFMGGHSLSTYIYKKMVEKNPKNARPGWKATALLTGVPILSGLVGKYGTKALLKYLNKD